MAITPRPTATSLFSAAAAGRRRRTTTHSSRSAASGSFRGEGAGGGGGARAVHAARPIWKPWSREFIAVGRLRFRLAIWKRVLKRLSSESGGQQVMDPCTQL